MEKVEGLELSQLVGDAGQAVQDEKRRLAIKSIQALLTKDEMLVKEIRGMESQLKKKQETRGKLVARLERIKAGDWSALEEPKDEKADSGDQGGGQ